MIGSRIRRYIMMKYLTALFLVTGIFMCTILLVDVVEQLRTIGSDIGLPIGTAIQLSLMKLPMLVEQAMPFALLVASILTYVQLNQSSELSVIRATGQSAWSFLMPVIIPGACLGVLVMTILNPFGAAMVNRFETMRVELLREGGAPVESRASNVWLRQGSDDQQIIIHARSVDSSGRVFRNVRFIEEERKYDQGRPSGTFYFVRRLDAQSATIADGFWQLRNVVENTPDHPPRRIDSLAIETDLDPDKLLSRFTSPDTIGFWSLPGFIKQTKSAGLDSTRFEMRWFELTALPVLYIAMPLIGALVCLRLSRLGNNSHLIAVSVGAATVLFFTIQINVSFGSSGNISPVIAAWTPVLCALFISFGVLAYVEDG